MYCVKCGKFLDNDDRFCPACGKSNPDYLFCMKCGKPLDSKTRFCSGCGSQNPNYDYDPYTPGINPPPAGYNGEAGFNGGQTISPYADDPVPNAQAKATQNSVPPVYTAENANAVGFVNPGTPAPDNNGSINNTNINGIKNNKKTGHIVAAGIAMMIAAIAGITIAGAKIGQQIGREPSLRNHSYSDDYVPKEYTFNPLNNIKEPEVIWETDTVKVSTLNIIHDSSFSSSAKLQLQIENKSDNDILVRTDKVLINGYDVNASVYESVSKKSTVTDSVYIDLDILEKLNIENINNIDLWFKTENKADYNVVETSDKITVETKNTADNELFEPDTILFDHDGVRVGYYGTEYSGHYDNSMNIEVYFENNTDKIIDFDLDSFKINGKDIKPYQHAVLYPESKGIFDFWLSEEKLKTIRIDSVEDIDDIVFSVEGTHQTEDAETHRAKTETVFTTGPLSVSTH